MISRRHVIATAGLSAGLAGIGAVATAPQAAAAGAPTRGVSPVFDVKIYGAVGNGTTDDGPAIQAAINAAGTSNAKGTGGIVWFPPGVYRLGTGLTINQQVELAGAGWNPVGFAGPSTGATGSWLYVDSTAVNPIVINNTAYGTVIRDLAFAYNQPTPTSSSWAPANYPYAIQIHTTDVLLENILLFNPTLGISMTNPGSSVGRVTMNRIFGRPLKTGILVDDALDVVKTHNVHFWPFWQPANQFVAAWQRQNAIGICSKRNDNPQFSDIFILGYYEAMLFAAGAQGVTFRFKITNADFDAVTYGIHITGAGTNGQATNVTAGGEGPQLGAVGIFVETDNVTVQLTNTRVSQFGASGIRIQGTSRAVIENVWIDSVNGSGQGFPAIECVSPAVVLLGFGRIVEPVGSAAVYGGTGSIFVDKS